MRIDAGIYVASDLYISAKDDLIEHPNMELRTLLEFEAELVSKVISEVADLQKEYGNCSADGSAELANMLRQEADRFVPN